MPVDKQKQVSDSNFWYSPHLTKYVGLWALWKKMKIVSSFLGKAILKF